MLARVTCWISIIHVIDPVFESLIEVVIRGDA
jgi:hypothetical protein